MNFICFPLLYPCFIEKCLFIIPFRCPIAFVQQQKHSKSHLIIIFCLKCGDTVDNCVNAHDCTNVISHHIQSHIARLFLEFCHCIIMSALVTFFIEFIIKLEKSLPNYSRNIFVNTKVSTFKQSMCPHFI